jgi:hypothetical protein
VRCQSLGIEPRRSPTQRRSKASTRSSETSTGTERLKLGPAVLGVRLDGGLVLGESQLEANIGVQVDGPAALAIRRIQLLV